MENKKKRPRNNGLVATSRNKEDHRFKFCLKKQQNLKNLPKGKVFIDNGDGTYDEIDRSQISAYRGYPLIYT